MRNTIDAIVVDYRIGSYILAENNIRNIKVTGEPIAFSYSSFAVKKGNTKLLNAINNALQIIKADGTYQHIVDKWKPKEVVFYTQRADRTNYLQCNYKHFICIVSNCTYMDGYLEERIDQKKNC